MLTREWELAWDTTIILALHLQWMYCCCRWYWLWHRATSSNGTFHLSPRPPGIILSPRTIWIIFLCPLWILSPCTIWIISPWSFGIVSSWTLGIIPPCSIGDISTVNTASTRRLLCKHYTNNSGVLSTCTCMVVLRIYTTKELPIDCLIYSSTVESRDYAPPSRISPPCISSSSSCIGSFVSRISPPSLTVKWSP